MQLYKSTLWDERELEVNRNSNMPVDLIELVSFAKDKLF